MQLGQQGLEHVPTRETRAMVVIRKQRGCTTEQIAASLGMSLNTLMKHYEIELRDAKDAFTDKVFGKLAGLMECENESVAFNAQKFYLTHQAKWSSGDKDKEVDGAAAAAKAAREASELDALTGELKGHLHRDRALDEVTNNG